MLRLIGLPVALVMLMGGGAWAGAAADGPLLSDDSWRVRPGGRLTLDAGLALGVPAALPTGMSTGISGGLMIGTGLLSWGARASWATATESSIPWTVTRADLRLRALGALQGTAGRARIALRLGLGTTVVHETRLRNQGVRAGLTGTALETSALAALPAGDLELVALLHIVGPWLLTMSAGPSACTADGSLHAGWIAQLGVGWQP